MAGAFGTSGRQCIALMVGRKEGRRDKEKRTEGQTQQTKQSKAIETLSITEKTVLGDDGVSL